ncbi:iron-sulfur assembly protein, putative [Plasmodium ovale curtisi]|uniref:Iron-sulfur assembly protein, putative n=1 Tax=Plasmodium ovale curtisi TaxID=864141 RepID=A0A1A8VX78_PLAOA|nr:iron-sulfur assembly protein, putative [Plasmodium ovale curtisi]
MNKVEKNEKADDQSNCRVNFTFHFIYIKENKKTIGIDMKRYEDEDLLTNQLKQLVTEGKNGENLILRLSVQNGGCKGLQYKLNPIKTDEIEADDYVQQFDDLKFILSIDATSVIYIYNNILDYSSDLINGGFKYVFCDS